ncbi:uncharacterized protein CEXT_496771 [Caerostris extrusa]|uniref:Uncharacterized protein n=1 Tax=Caerostris extrusa TaxID=172846 RepID=A0AAV4NII8_CAEEX|nr:uncharacterized protein CEXT_496771 [Caerostris extrusa]
MNTLNETLDALEYDIYKHDLMHQISESEHTNPSRPNSRDGELDDFDTSSCSSLSAVTVLSKDMKKNFDVNSTGSRSLEKNLSEEFSTFRNSIYGVGKVMPGIFAETTGKDIERSPDGSEEGSQRKYETETIDIHAPTSRVPSPPNKRSKTLTNSPVVFSEDSLSESAAEYAEESSNASVSYSNGSALYSDISPESPTSYSIESSNAQTVHSMNSTKESNVYPEESTKAPTTDSVESITVCTALGPSNASATSPSEDEGKSSASERQPNKCHGHKSSNTERKDQAVKKSDKRHLLTKSPSTESVTTISTDMTTDSLESCPSSPTLERSSLLFESNTKFGGHVDKQVDPKFHSIFQIATKIQEKLVLPENRSG